jgi:hypothetical protein
MGPYIVDFVCMKKKLVVEVDGASHHEIGRRRLDRIRDGWFAAAGYAVLRITAYSVVTDLTGVLARITQALEEQAVAGVASGSPPPPAGPGRRGTPPLEEWLQTGPRSRQGTS